MKKCVKKSCLFTLVLLKLILNCTGARSPQDLRKGSAEIFFNNANGHITIKANEIPLHTLFSQLYNKYDILVVTSNHHPDPDITVQLTDIPIYQALKQILPKEVKFHVVTKDLEFEIAGNTGDKIKKKEPSVKDEKLPTKNKMPPIPDSLKPELKKQPEYSKSITYSNGSEGTKYAPSGLKIREGVGPKKIQKQVIPDESHTRLLLYIKDKKIRILEFHEITGAFYQSTTLNGTFLYAALINDSIIAVGSMQDPLDRRAYHEDYGHTDRRSEEAFFPIDLPSQFLARDSLMESVINFYSITPTSPIPQELLPETFLKIQKLLEKVDSISGEELIKAYDTRYGRGGK